MPNPSSSGACPRSVQPCPDSPGAGEAAAACCRRLWCSSLAWGLIPDGGVVTSPIPTESPLVLLVSLFMPGKLPVVPVALEGPLMLERLPGAGGQEEGLAAAEGRGQRPVRSTLVHGIDDVGGSGELLAHRSPPARRVLEERGEADRDARRGLRVGDGGVGGWHERHRPRAGLAPAPPAPPTAMDLARCSRDGPVSCLGVAAAAAPC